MPKKQKLSSSKKKQKKKAKESQSECSTSQQQPGQSQSKTSTNMDEIKRILNQCKREEYAKVLENSIKGNEELREFCIKWSDRMAIGNYDDYIDEESKMYFVHELKENLCWAANDLSRSELVLPENYRERIQHLTEDYVETIKFNRRNIRQVRMIENSVGQMRISEGEKND